VPVTLSLEMFERDVQESVDTYVGGTAAEADFPQRDAAVAPLFDRLPSAGGVRQAHKWPVVAANVPRRIAIGDRQGWRSAVDALSASDRRLAASDLQCPHDDYYTRFAETMGTHPAASSGSGAAASAADTATERYYWAQCMKDETMAESIAKAFAKARRDVPDPSCTYGCVPLRLRRGHGGTRPPPPCRPPRHHRHRDSRDSLDDLSPDSDDLKRADYLIFTIK
jgi:hypothetical protein